MTITFFGGNVRRKKLFFYRKLASVTINPRGRFHPDFLDAGYHGLKTWHAKVITETFDSVDARGHPILRYNPRSIPYSLLDKEKEGYLLEKFPTLSYVS